MPTITFSFEDLCKLTGQKLDEKKLTYLLSCAKAELESQLSREVSVKFNDTNQPYLWSVEGLARLFRGILGKEKGIPKVKTEAPIGKVIVDKRLSSIRPFVACFVAKGRKIDDYLLKQLIQLQEKLAENFGRKRQKISIGVYPLRKITFPVYFKAASPSEKFVPLDSHSPMSLQQVLERHPKGKEYGHILKGKPFYPVFLDAKKDILSLAPIINSEETGRVQVGDDSLLFDTTGMDMESVDLVANIFAYALADRGFKIYPLTIEYASKKVTTPSFEVRSIKFNEDDVERLLGIKLKQAELKVALEKMRYDYSSGKVLIPPYRHDIMHAFDVVEDVGIMYGYDNFKPLPLSSYTIGGTFEIQRFIDTIRELWVGLSYQEVLSPVLSSKDLLYDKMNISDLGTVEIENPMSNTYAGVRSWLMPIMMDVLSRNKHVDFPQRIFEQGIISVRDKENVHDQQHLSAVSCHSSAGFTEMKQAVDYLLRMSNIKYSLEELEMSCFVPGRAASIMVDNKNVGFFGELHPAVLEHFGLELPVSGCELNLSVLFECKK
ncbi:MAG TPA: phenylalanine--tRNA ligase subunit beta [Candidatus Nanoarchaeia archaeon]|nr:phenylalanine--tRNA ligase subunit beta [Candidatus Nanoarchaeia archaeon]